MLHDTSQNYTTTSKERTGHDPSKEQEDKKYLLPLEILNAGNALQLAMLDCKAAAQC